VTALPSQYAERPAFSFGDSADMADRGARDVVTGKQTATCGAFELLSKNLQAMPQEGLVEIVLGGRGDAVCAIETWKTDIALFREIDEDFAKAEACSSLSEWRRIHEAYFRRLGCFSEDMKLVRQYFRVLEVFSSEHRGPNK